MPLPLLPLRRPARLRPRVEAKIALSPNEVATFRGHPTAPGPRDRTRRRRGGASPGNGTPNIPLVQMLPESHGPGIPGPTPTGPTMPGVFIEERTPMTYAAQRLADEKAIADALKAERGW